MRNCVSAPEVAGLITCPKLLELKQSNKVSGALPVVPLPVGGESHPARLPTPTG